MKIFKQTDAKYSLYPLKSQWELFELFLDQHSLLFLVISIIIMITILIFLIIVFKNSFVIESGMLRNFLVEGV